MPTLLKGALVRETARRGSNVNDVAAGILAESFDVTYRPSGRRRKKLAGTSPVLLLRVPPELKDEIHAEAARTGTNANDVILAALTDGLGIPRVSNRKDTMAETNGSKNRTARTKDKVRVALIGVGNCANSLLQGVEYYKDAKADDGVPQTVASIEEVQLYVRDTSGKRVDVTFQELVNKTMGAVITRADLHIGRTRDGELLLTSRQDGTIRMLVADDGSTGTTARGR